MATHKVFVYGSLMSGLHNDTYLDGQTRLGDDRTRGCRFEMVDLGAFPGLVQMERGDDAVGEVWEVDDECLADLDRLEGVPTFYDRVTVQTVTHGWCWAYVLGSKFRGEDAVPGNDWRRHWAAKCGRVDNRVGRI